MKPFPIFKLLEQAAIRVDSVFGAKVDVTGFQADSRLIQPGDLFFSMPSTRSDTTEYLRNAQAAGAVACVVAEEKSFSLASELGLTTLLITQQNQNFFAAVGRLCKVLTNDPSSRLKLLAVTGTNGKTTTAWLVRQALNAIGKKTGYLGTLGISYGETTRELNNTTPFPVEFWKLLQEVEDAGMEYLALEASSHALYQRRLAGVSFLAGVFTNLSQDHLDFHGSMEEYADAKKLLFTEYAMCSSHPFVAAINVDDPVAAGWVSDLPVSTVTYGQDSGDWRLNFSSIELDKITASMQSGASFSAAVGGNFNASNLLSASALLHAIGLSDEEICTGFAAVSPVPGRFETIQNSHGVGVLVDYAHTPDALEKLLQSTRDLQPKRIIAVFGCGGDRDRTKRPKMAAIASRMSDLCIVTSDNPRTENPDAIIAEVLTGIADGASAQSVVDRREAISQAIMLAEKGDVVVIAGKGHENYQIIGHTKYPMDDREIAREALNCKH